MKPMVGPDSNVRTFDAKVDLRAASADSLLCVGLDPHRGRMPDGIPETGAGTVQFCTRLIEATSPFALAYKPNLAFFLALGRGGLEVLYEVCAAVPDDIPVILDCKVGDIDSTARAYATAWLDELDVDAITVHPYLGEDSLEPFLRHADKGVLILAKTSNPGSGDLQDRALAETGQPLYEYVAERAAAWSQTYPASVGLVVGATWPSQLAAIREVASNQHILLPGVGAQGGDIGDSLRAGLRADGGGLFCSSSRGIMYASSGDDFAEAAGRAAMQLRDQINGIRSAIPAT